MRNTRKPPFGHAPLWLSVISLCSQHGAARSASEPDTIGVPRDGRATRPAELYNYIYCIY
jgi:hypothetical protein